MAHGNELNNKKYYWLKLDRHFFGNARIKKLRRLAGGDTYTIIYLKLLLLSIEFGGVLIYEGIEDTFEKEMALKLEEEDENVLVTINYLKIQGLLVEKGEDSFLPEAASSIGSETKNNVYKREKKKVVGIIPTPFQPHSNQIPIEIEIEKEIDKELEVDKNKAYTIGIPNGNQMATIGKPSIGKVSKGKISLVKDNINICGQATPTQRFIPPTLENVKNYCAERNNNVNAQRFIDFYESKGWIVGKTKMKDWKACVRTWENNSKMSIQSKESTNMYDVLDQAFEED